VAANYAAQARVLANSFAEHHPGRRLQVLVIDDREGRLQSDTEPFDVLRPADLPMSERQFHEMAAIYDVMELATAVKPSLLLALLERNGAAPTVYLDPDILVLAPLDELTDVIEKHSIVLTPHTSEPMPRDDKKPSEFDILASGTWNLGFAGVNAGAKPFLEWWVERLRFDALVDHANMQFTDQRWIDLAGAYFDIHALRDPRYNLAYWNADHRPIELRGGRYLVGGQPLCFVHFSGFDPRRPHILSKHQGDAPRILLSEYPELARLCKEYADLLAAQGLEAERGIAYGWSRLPDGTKLTPAIRRTFRQGLIKRERAERENDGSGRREQPSESAPDPFDPEAVGDLMVWLASPDADNRAAPAIPRLFWEIYCRRTDLQVAYPLAGSTESSKFRSWIWQFGRREEEIPGRVLAAAFGIPTWPRKLEPAWSPAGRLHPGYLVAGYLRAESGLGEAARLAISTMRVGGIPFGAYSFGLTPSRQDHSIDDLPTRSDLNTNVVWISPEQLPLFARSVGPSFFDGRYTVGSWAWETDRLPRPMAEMHKYIDEIWVPSEYSAAAVRARVDGTEVCTVPHPIIVPALDATVTRAQFGIPDAFTFFFMFDFLSTSARKNPVGLVEAFTAAFRPGEGPVLVLKSINGDRFPLERERLQLTIDRRPDVFVLDRYLSPATCAALVAMADCYVSLHRSEGFGLTIAEAMALGVPVVATACGGNLDFMDEETTYLVPWKSALVGEGAAPYDPGDSWADPDLDAAADVLRRVYERPDEAREKAARARQKVLTEHGRGHLARVLADRFAVIQTKILDGYESPVTGIVAAEMHK
jgi:glycosyltransferase involved in cell wall biosynthesis